MAKSGRQFSTDELTAGFLRTKDFKRYIGSHSEHMTDTPLHEYLAQLLEKKQMKRAEVIQHSNIDRTFGYQIFDGTKSPSRDKVLQLAMGFGLNYAETSELLRVARKSALYPRLRREAVIVYAIGHGLSVFETQYMLIEAGLPQLGEEKD